MWLPKWSCEISAVGISCIFSLVNGGGPAPSIWFNNCDTIESNPSLPQT